MLARLHGSSGLYAARVHFAHVAGARMVGAGAYLLSGYACTWSGVSLLMSIFALERPQFVVRWMPVSGDRAVVNPRRSVPR